MDPGGDLSVVAGAVEAAFGLGLDLDLDMGAGLNGRPSHSRPVANLRKPPSGRPADLIYKGPWRTVKKIDTWTNARCPTPG